MRSAEREGAGSEGRVGFAAPPRLRLVPLGPEAPDPQLLDWLAQAIGVRLGADVVTETVAPAAEDWWSEERSQLCSNAIVDTLIERYPPGTGGEWVLAVTAADLRGGGRQYVFGEAAAGGFWAVLSTARFGAAGEPEFRKRVLKEALHELGHLAGLGHCPDEGCLMAASVDVAQVDAKGAELCRVCRRSESEKGT